MECCARGGVQFGLGIVREVKITAGYLGGGPRGRVGLWGCRPVTMACVACSRLTRGKWGLGSHIKNSSFSYLYCEVERMRNLPGIIH